MVLCDRARAPGMVARGSEVLQACSNGHKEFYHKEEYNLNKEEDNFNKE